MTISFSTSKPHLKPIEVNKEEASSLTLMDLLRKAQFPVASSCKGDGICSKCRINIIYGKENLTPEKDLENRTKVKNQVPISDRLSCQTYLCGDIVIDTLYW